MSESRDRAPDALRNLRHLLVDMDGVLFRGSTVLPGAADFLSWLRAREVSFLLLTNNSTATPKSNASRLASMGVVASVDEVFTSAQATAQYLIQEGAAGASVYVVGEDGLREALTQAGLRIVDSAPAQWVVAGLDRKVTYDSLAEAGRAIDTGAKFVATNADTSLPVETGRVPGAGALQAAITATTGISPTVVGKPEPRMLEQAMKRLDGTLSSTAMLGDRLDTDIEAARRAGMPSILVLTGVSSREDLAGSHERPDVMCNDLPELMSIWKRTVSE